MNHKRASKDGLDDLDRAIMTSLRTDGRKTYADLAKELAAPEATVRKRFRRLVRDGYLQITAMKRLELSDATYDVSIAMRVAPGCLWSVARMVAGLDGVRFVAITTGDSDIQLAANFPTNQQVLDFLAARLGPIPGIESIQTSQILRHVKRDYEFVPDPDGRAAPAPAVPADDETCARLLTPSTRRRAQKGVLDELDRAIMRSLQSDGRKTYADLAKELAAPEATVRKRFQKLVRDGYLEILALGRVEQTAAAHNMFIAIRTLPQSQLSVADAVARLDAVRWVALAMGEAHVLLTANFATDRALLHFLSEELGAIPGMKSMQVTHVLHYVRRNYRWIPED